MLAKGTIAELVLLDEMPAARILCTAGLVPAPGQYLRAFADESDNPIAESLFLAQPTTDGFLAVPPAPRNWKPGSQIHMHGPLGHGFTLPSLARRVALIAHNNEPRRVLALLEIAFKQGAAVTLVCDTPVFDLPLQVEVQPLRMLVEVCKWSDYAALDVTRESLPDLIQNLGSEGSANCSAGSQILVRAPMPCGGLAECGVCTVRGLRGPQLICEYGPVFDLSLFAFER